MEDRDILMSYNDISFTDEEIEKYEDTQVKEEILKKMKDRITCVYYRVNFDEGLSKLENEFDEGEKSEYIFTAESYGVNGAKMLTGCVGTTTITAGVWTDWGTRGVVLLTNKRIFIIHANDAFQFLNVKAYRFDELESIETKQIPFENKIVVLSIKPINEKAVRFNLYSDKYMYLIKYIMNNATNVKIYIERTKFKDKAIAATLWGILITIILMGFYTAISRIAQHPEFIFRK